MCVAGLAIEVFITVVPRESSIVNHQKVYRRYRETDLIAAPQNNHAWSMEFVIDTLANDHRFKCLIIVDDYTTEYLDIPVAYGILSEQIVRTLEIVIYVQQ